MTCAQIAEDPCHEYHLVLNIPSKKPADGQSLQKRIRTFKIRSKLAIGEYEKIQIKLGKLHTCIKAVEQNVKGQIEDNDLRMAKLMSAVYDIDKKTNGTETIEAFEKKMDQMTKDADEQIKMIARLAEIMKQEKFLRLRINLETRRKQRIPTIPLLEQGYWTDLLRPERNHEMFLLHHLVFFILKQHLFNKGPLKPVENPSTLLDVPKTPEFQTPALRKPLQPQASSAMSNISTVPNFTSIPSQITTGKKLILTFQDLGEVHIKPSQTTLYSAFTEKLVIFCKPSARLFKAEISEVT